MNFIPALATVVTRTCPTLWARFIIPAYAPGEFIGGKGLAEAHFAVPQEMGRFMVLSPVTLEVCHSLCNGFLLFGPHGESEIPLLFDELSLAHGENRPPDLLQRVAEPLARLALYAVDAQHFMHLVVAEGRAVAPHGGFFQHDAVGHARRAELLLHALMDLPRGVADFQQALVRGHTDQLIGVDFGLRRWALWEKAVIRLHG